MTEDQAAQLIALAQQHLAAQTDAATQLHVLSGVEQFIAHVLVGVFCLVLIFGLVVASGLRRRGS